MKKIVKKDKRGGSGRGQGRKRGVKAFVNTKPNPTKVMRIPIPLISAVNGLIENFKRKTSVL